MRSVFYLPENRSEPFFGCLEIFTPDIARVGELIKGAKKVDEMYTETGFHVFVDRSIKIFGNLSNALSMLLDRGILDGEVLLSQLRSTEQAETFYHCLELTKSPVSALLPLLLEVVKSLPPDVQTVFAAQLATTAPIVGQASATPVDVVSDGRSAGTLFKAATLQRG